MNYKQILPAILAALLVAVCLLSGCEIVTDEYYKCQKCGAAYKSPAFKGGLPGQTNTRTCRGVVATPSGFCGGRLIKCTEAESGWDEGRYQAHDNEIPY